MKKKKKTYIDKTKLNHAVYKCIAATYLSRGPLTLLIEIVDRVSMVQLRDR